MVITKNSKNPMNFKTLNDVISYLANNNKLPENSEEAFWNYVEQQGGINGLLEEVMELYYNEQNKVTQERAVLENEKATLNAEKIAFAKEKAEYVPEVIEKVVEVEKQVEVMSPEDKAELETLKQEQKLQEEMLSKRTEEG